MKGASHQVLHRWLIFSLCSLLLWPQCSALFLPWPCGRAVCWLSAPSPSFIHILLVAPDSQEKPWNSYPFSNQQRCWSRQFLLPLSDTSTGNQAQLWDLEEGLTEGTSMACDNSGCSSTLCPTSTSRDASFLRSTELIHFTYDSCAIHLLARCALKELKRQYNRLSTSSPVTSSPAGSFLNTSR